MVPRIAPVRLATDRSYGSLGSYRELEYVWISVQVPDAFQLKKTNASSVVGTANAPGLAVVNVQLFESPAAFVAEHVTTPGLCGPA